MVIIIIYHSLKLPMPCLQGNFILLGAIKVLTILDVKKGKLEEAMARMVNFESMFLNIAGYEHEMATFYNVEEALAVIGMSLPE